MPHPTNKFPSKFKLPNLYACQSTSPPPPVYDEYVTYVGKNWSDPSADGSPPEYNPGATASSTLGNSPKMAAGSPPAYKTQRDLVFDRDIDFDDAACNEPRKRKGCIHGFCQTPNWGGILAAGLMWSWLFVLILILHRYMQDSGLFVFYFYDISVLMYLLYLVECGYSSTCQYLGGETLSSKSFIDWIVKVRQRQPKLTGSVLNYHIGGGKRRRKIYTSIDTFELQYEWCRDVTDPGYLDWANPLLRVSCNRVLTFADTDTKNKYFQTVQYYTSLYKKDRCQEFALDWSVDGYHERLREMIVEKSPDLRPAFIDRGSFWMASILLQSLPYRYWFQAVYQKKRLTIIKEIGGIPGPPS